MPEAIASIPYLDVPRSASSSPWPRVGWGIFLTVCAAALLVSLGARWDISLLVGIMLLGLFVWKFPLVGFYIWMATTPLLGLLISLPTGSLKFGERAFGGSIDVQLGELVAFAVLSVWALRMLLLWKRRDRNWKPWLPFFGLYLLLVAAHLLSAFSAVAPDQILVFKYSLRPVLWVYLACVILPANFISTRERLQNILFIFGMLGIIFSLDGFRSLFSFSSFGFFDRAHPLPILGVSPLGGNHNALAELLLFSAPAILAWAALKRSLHLMHWSVWAAGFMVLISLLTLARSAWLAFFCMVVLSSLTVWKPWIKRNGRKALLILLVVLPLGILMMNFSLSQAVQGSTDARALLTRIALFLFEQDPWLGAGAGSFMDRVSHTYAYTVEFGAAVESHGIIQKLLSETGLIGFAAFLLFCAAVILYVIRTWRSINKRQPEFVAYAYLTAGLLGAMLYQFFDTTYWTSRLWLPFGLLLAAGQLFLHGQTTRDPDFLSPHG